MIPDTRKQIGIAAVLALLVLVTRGSHAGTSFSLPDATLAAMLLGGILLERGTWFFAMMALCCVIDAFAVGVAGVSSYCLSPAYWALLPTYGAMWLGGRWLAGRNNAFAFFAYFAVALVSTTLAFLISTYSFFMLSGKFPNAPLWEVMQHGWEYYASYLGYTLMYLGLGWILLREYGYGVATSTSVSRVRA